MRKGDDMSNDRLKEENGLCRPDPIRYDRMRNSYARSYSEALVASARERNQAIRQKWGYWCPFCCKDIDSGVLGYQSCPHLISFGAPTFDWFGLLWGKFKRFREFVADVLANGINIKSFSKGSVFWERLEYSDWHNLSHVLPFHNLLLDLAVPERGEISDFKGEVHFLLAEEICGAEFWTGLTQLQKALSGQSMFYTRRLKALETAKDGLGLINIVPVALSELSPRKARIFLLQALHRSDTAALGAVYAAAMAVYGCPIGGASIAAMSHGFLMRVRRAVTEIIGLEILEAARHHSSELVRNSVKKQCETWIEAQGRSRWPAQYPRWPQPNPEE